MNPSLAAEQPSAIGLSRALVTLLAFCCGAIVANIYYAQPIVGLIAPDLGLSNEHASLIVSLTQLGYALGLLLLAALVTGRFEGRVPRRREVGCRLLGHGQRGAGSSSSRCSAVQ